MSIRLRGLAICLVILIICAASGPGIVCAQDEVHAGRNINMVSGLYYFGEESQPVTLGGDPYLQRQNEPSIAVSTRNPMHLLAGANDYRTVDIPFSDSEMVGDAWLGLFKSFDGGQTWQSTLLPHYPQSQADGGTGCPKKYDGTDMDSILGCQAAADPTVRAGTNGMFYYSGIAFDRNKKHLSRLFVSRFIDLNNREGIYFDVPANKDPIKYIDTHVVNIGTPGQFTDKPWLAVDVPRGANPETFDRHIDDYLVSKDDDGNLIETPTTVHQTFKCGNVYLAYSVFLGNFGNTKLDKPITEKTANQTHTRIEVLRSTDCGETWEKNKGNISAGYHVNQGVTLAVDPKDGDLYVAWQVFDSAGLNPQVVVARSTDYGENFGTPVPVADTKPFNQGTRPANPDDSFRLFRTNAYPTMAVDDKERVYVAWSERGNWGKDHLPPNHPDGSRIMISYSADQGSNWKGPYSVDDSDLDNCTVPYDPALCRAGHHIMPSLSYGGGKLTLLFYDFRNDLYADLYNAILKKADCSGAADPALCTEPLDRSLPPADAIAFEPFPVRHTVDARVVVTDATQDYDPLDKDTWPFYKKPSLSLPVSKYASTIMPDLSVTGATRPLKLYQLQSNQVNLPLFLKGTSPFIGDYIDIAASSRFVTKKANPEEWEYNSNLQDASIFHAAWTDNRDVMPPPAKIVENDAGDFELERPNWTEYKPPTGAVWAEGSWPGMRNQNIYTSRITEGLVLGAYGNSKPLNIERAFSIFVENTKPEFDETNSYLPKSRKFNLTLVPANGVDVCFDPFPSAGNCPNTSLSKELTVPSMSRAALTVFARFVSGSEPPAGSPIGHYLPSITVVANESGGTLHSSLVLNPDPTNPAPLNADAEGDNLSNLEKRSLEFVPFSCSDFEKLPDEVNTNCEDGGESVSSLLIQWPLLFDVSDPALHDLTLLNPALLNTTENPALLNPALLNPALLNPALLNPALLNPALLNDPLAPALLNPALLNPALLNPALLNPALLNPALLNPALLNPALLNDPLAPALLNPALLNSALLNPALLNPALLNPALLNPALLNPALLNNPSTPALLNPALLNPALLNPALLNPALLNPALLNTLPGPGDSLNLSEIAKNTWLIQNNELDPVESTPPKPAALTDLTWRVKNTGNNGSSYLFSWNSNSTPPVNPSQILVYRTYRTPSIDPGSYLLNEAGLHYEFLLNVLEAGFLAPGLNNAALRFSLAPASNLPSEKVEDFIYITLRFKDDKPEDGNAVVNSNEVAISVEPEASIAGTSTPEDLPTFTTLFSSEKAPPSHDDEVTFTASVDAINGTATGLSGDVTFKDGDTVLGTEPLTGNPANGYQADLKTKLSAGSHTIRAEFKDNSGKFRASTSEPVIQHVKKLKQKIKFDNLPNLEVGLEYTLDAASYDDANQLIPWLVVSFSTHSKNCSVDGDKLKVFDTGTCVVKASQAGNGAYRPARPVVRHKKAN